MTKVLKELSSKGQFGLNSKCRESFKISLKDAIMNENLCLKNLLLLIILLPLDGITSLSSKV